jgi:hypothetical protein
VFQQVDIGTHHRIVVLVVHKSGDPNKSTFVHNGFAENRYPTPGARMTIGTAGK